MMQMGIIKDPTQYIQVMNTGRIDVMFEGDVSQQLLVRQENEWLAEGKNPIVSPFDIKQIKFISTSYTVTNKPRFLTLRLF
jgi:hypothetical protein